MSLKTTNSRLSPLLRNNKNSTSLLWRIAWGSELRRMRRLRSWNYLHISTTSEGRSRLRFHLYSLVSSCHNWIPRRRYAQSCIISICFIEVQIDFMFLLVIIICSIVDLLITSHSFDLLHLAYFHFTKVLENLYWWYYCGLWLLLL